MPARKIDIIRPNIFQYHDYLSFLKDWIEFLKRTDRGFSMRKLAENAQLASGYLPMCLSSKRILSTRALHKLFPHLKLNPQEKRYLELLHVVSTTEEPQVRTQAIEDMSRMPAFRQYNSKETDVYEYLSQWFYVAIREMVSLADFKADPAWIQRRLRGKIGLAACEDALAFLLDKGLIAKDENGRFTQPKTSLDCRDGIFKASLSEFHRQMFQLAAQSIESVPRADRYILGLTLPVAPGKMEQIRSILDDAQTKLQALGEDAEGAEQVYHVEMASFPLTRTDAASEGKEE